MENGECCDVIRAVGALLWAAQALLCSRLSQASGDFGHPAAGQEAAQAQGKGSCPVPQEMVLQLDREVLG